jgi:hypothetical protein
MLVALLAGTILVPAVARGASATTVVVCAPGYPGSTEEAQPTLDDLARALERAAGEDGRPFGAIYHPTVEGGVAALADPQAGFLLAPLPFYLEQRERFALGPLLQVVPIAGPTEIWSMVARRGAVDGPASLAGWELDGMLGYSPRFVRRIALGDWGELPADLRIAFRPRLLPVLRRAVAGERVAAILDRAQTQALETMPFASELEVVARSRPLVGSLLCRLRGRVPDEEGRRLTAAFLGLEAQEGGRALLDTLRIHRFEPLDAEELSRIERAFAVAGAAPR